MWQFFIVTVAILGTTQTLPNTFVDGLLDTTSAFAISKFTWSSTPQSHQRSEIASSSCALSSTTCRPSLSPDSSPIRRKRMEATPARPAAASKRLRASHRTTRTQTFHRRVRSPLPITLWHRLTSASRIIFTSVRQVTWVFVPTTCKLPFCFTPFFDSRSFSRVSPLYFLPSPPFVRHG